MAIGRWSPAIFPGSNPLGADKVFKAGLKVDREGWERPDDDELKLEELNGDAEVAGVGGPLKDPKNCCCWS